MSEPKRPYQQVSRYVWRKMLSIAHRLDVKARPPGLYDARSMAINVWVSPEDRPPCWAGTVMIAGTYPEPREYLGAIELVLEHPTESALVSVLVGNPPPICTLQLSCTPYERGVTAADRRRRSTRSGPYPEPLEDEWEWLTQKADELLAMAEEELKPIEEETSDDT